LTRTIIQIAKNTENRDKGTTGSNWRNNLIELVPQTSQVKAPVNNNYRAQVSPERRFELSRDESEQSRLLGKSLKILARRREGNL